MFKVFDIAREALGSVAKAAAKVPVIEKFGEVPQGGLAELPASFAHDAEG